MATSNGFGSGATGYAKQVLDAYNQTGNWDTAYATANAARGGATGMTYDEYKTWYPNATGVPVVSYGGTQYVGGNTNGAYTGASIPAPPAPDYDDPPQAMSWEEALKQAGNAVNPTYNSLRTDAEMDYSTAREQIPQLLAARYGMSGTRGGRSQSAYTQNTQKENASIGKIEDARQSAIQVMARSIQSQDYEMAMKAYQMAESLKQQAYANEYQAWRDSVLDKNSQQQLANSDYWKQLEYQRLLNNDRSSTEQWQKSYDFTQSKFDWEKDPNNPENLYKQALTYRTYNPISSGSSSSGGLTPYQLLTWTTQQENEGRAWVTDRVANDPRLSTDSSNYQQLYDAWMNVWNNKVK